MLHEKAAKKRKGISKIPTLRCKISYFVIRCKISCGREKMAVLVFASSCMEDSRLFVHLSKIH